MLFRNTSFSFILRKACQTFPSTLLFCGLFPRPHENAQIRRWYATRKCYNSHLRVFDVFSISCVSVCGSPHFRCPHCYDRASFSNVFTLENVSECLSVRSFYCGCKAKTHRNFSNENAFSSGTHSVYLGISSILHCCSASTVQRALRK